MVADVLNIDAPSPHFGHGTCEATSLFTSPAWQAAMFLCLHCITADSGFFRRTAFVSLSRSPL